MSEVVDSIIAELVARDNGYITTFEKAIRVHERFTASVPKIGAAMGISSADAKRYADRHSKAANDVAGAAEKSAARVKKAAKEQSVAEIEAAKAASVAKKAASDVEKTAARETAAAARQAAREKVAAAREIEAANKAAAISAAALAAKEAERDANAARRIIHTSGDNPGLRPAIGGRVGSTVPNEPSGQKTIPLAVLNGTDVAPVVAAEAEVNHLLADRFDLTAKAAVAEGAVKRELKDEIEYLRRIDAYKRAGLTESEATIRAEAELLAIERLRVNTAKQQAGAGLKKGAEQFARGAGAYAAIGGGAAIAGLAAAAGVAIGAEVIASAIAYGKAIENLSKQLGISVEDLQAYQKIARDTGVTTEQLTSAFGQFSSNLGRAQEGGKEQIKVFTALGIGIKDFKSAGDALPTVIDRISQIAEPAKRAAVETRLFGEQGRRLDALLSGGPEKVAALARSLQETGQALSAKEIQELDQTARKLADIKNALSVDLSRIVAGNSASIIGLANSFGILANSILNTIGKLQQFGAAQIRASSLASPGDKALARQFSLSTPDGRKRLLAENTQAILDTGAGNGSIDLRGVNTVRGIEQQRQARIRQLGKERAEIRAADAADKSLSSTATPVQAGNVNSGLLNKLNAPDAKKGKSAASLAAEAEARLRRYNDQLAAFQESQLRAEAEMTGDIDKRADTEKKLADRALKKQFDDIESQRKENVLKSGNGGEEAARAKALRDAAQSDHNANIARIEQQRQADIGQATIAHQQTRLQTEAEILNYQLDFARTAKERRTIELRLLDLAIEEERAALERQKTGLKPGDPGLADVQAKIDALPAKRNAEARQIDKREQGPLAAYLDQLPRTAKDLDEALQRAAVNGLTKLNDGLSTTLTRLIGLHGAAGDFLNDLIQIGLQYLEGQAFGGGQGNGGGGGGFLGSILSVVGSIFGGPRAGGGPVTGGRTYLVGEHGPEIFTADRSGTIIPNHTIMASSPNVAASNQRVSSSAPQLTIMAPQHFDLRGVFMNEDTLLQLEARNRAYANAVGQAAFSSAVSTAGGQVPGIVNKKQTLG